MFAEILNLLSFYYKTRLYLEQATKWYSDRCSQKSLTIFLTTYWENFFFKAAELQLNSKWNLLLLYFNNFLLKSTNIFWFIGR